MTSTETHPQEITGIQRESFGTTPDGERVELFTLTSSGAQAQVLTRGAAIRSLRVPGRDGHLGDVVLGYESLDGYLGDRAYLGAVVGRFANRIRAGRFELDGTEYQLPLNDGPNHLHGGPRGFHSVVWTAEPVRSAGGVGVALRYTSPDGEQGYPGRLEVEVVYTLTDDSALIVQYRAVTDRQTPINLSQHAYFNLAGAGEGSVLDHEVMVAADAYVPIDASGIPLGEVEPVHGTPFDFTTPHALGARIDAEHPQLRAGHGYDHTLVLRGPAGELRPAARVVEPVSGRTLEVLTTEPGVQLYSGNHLDGVHGKGGRIYGRRSGFCLETQHFPDSPNQPGFPSSVLRPGREFSSRTVFRFGVAG